MIFLLGINEQIPVNFQSWDKSFALNQGNIYLLTALSMILSDSHNVVKTLWSSKLFQEVVFQVVGS